MLVKNHLGLGRPVPPSYFPAWIHDAITYVVFDFHSLGDVQLRRLDMPMFEAMHGVLWLLSLFGLFKKQNDKQQKTTPKVIFKLESTLQKCLLTPTFNLWRYLSPLICKMDGDVGGLQVVTTNQFWSKSFQPFFCKVRMTDRQTDMQIY